MNPAELEHVGAALADLAMAAPDIELVVLFGSRVGERARKGSDLDVAVRGDALADLDAVFLVLAARLGTHRLDPVDLRRAGSLLAFEIARSGRVVYERRGGAFRQFQSLASRRYCDTAKLRAAQKRAIHRYLERERLA